MTERALTSKQEHFAQLVASGSKNVDAYRDAYNVASTTSSHTVWQNAYMLRDHTAVTLRIAELQASDQAIMLEKRAFTADTLIQEAVTNLEGARNDHQWGSANGALDWIGKATGLVSDKVQPGAVAVTKIVINLAPGVVMPARLMVDVPESHEVEEIEDESGRDLPDAPVSP